MRPPRVAVLTRYDSKFGDAFLQALKAQHFAPELLIVEHTPLSRRIGLWRKLAKRIGWIDATRYNMRYFTPILKRALKIANASRIPNWHGRARQVVHVHDINASASSEALARLAPEITVLAQSGIVRDPILRAGGVVLNAHPGLIPAYRGVDVVKWALLDRQPVVVSLHIVDAGVDTGPVLRTQIVPVYSDDSIASVAHRATEISIAMLVDAVVRKVPEPLPPSATKKGKQRYLMPFRVQRLLSREWPEIRAKLLDTSHQV